MRAGKSAEAAKGKDVNYIHNEDQCRSQGVAAEHLGPILCGTALHEHLFCLDVAFSKRE